MFLPLHMQYRQVPCFSALCSRTFLKCKFFFAWSNIKCSITFCAIFFHNHLCLKLQENPSRKTATFAPGQPGSIPASALQVGKPCNKRRREAWRARRISRLPSSATAGKGTVAAAELTSTSPVPPVFYAVGLCVLRQLRLRRAQSLCKPSTVPDQPRPQGIPQEFFV
jgi:hypothetical protein